MIRNRSHIGITNIGILILILISISIVNCADLSEKGKMEDEYVDVEKEVYEKGEKIHIKLKNDGSATWSPLSQYLKIYREDSGELVYDGHQDIAMPAIPKKQTVLWNQTDTEGDEVEPGNYRAVFLEKYEAEFVIEE